MPDFPAIREDDDMERESRSPTGTSACAPSETLPQADRACPLAASCGLPAAITRVALLLWQRAYCDRAGGFESCARFRMTSGGQPFAEELLPSGAIARRA